MMFTSMTLTSKAELLDEQQRISIWCILARLLCRAVV